MITKGIKQEAKIAVSYVLKHFYCYRTIDAADNALTRVFSQTYDFDLINYLAITGDIYGDIAGATASVMILIDGAQVEKVENLEDRETVKIFEDCTEIKGEKTIEVRLSAGEAAKYVALNNLSIYPMSQYSLVPV